MDKLSQLSILFGCLVLLVGCQDIDATSKVTPIPEHLNPDYQPPDENCPIESQVYPVTSNIDHIIITEVIHDIDLHGNWWIELYNPTDEPISIQNYSLKTPLFKLYNNFYVPDTKIKLDSNNKIIDRGKLSGARVESKIMFNIQSDTLSLPLAHDYLPPIDKEKDFFVYAKESPKNMSLSEYDFSTLKSSLVIKPHDYLVLFRRANLQTDTDIDLPFPFMLQVPSRNPKLHYIHESYLTKEEKVLKRHTWQHGMFSTGTKDYAGVGLYDGKGLAVDFVRFGTTTDQVLAASKTEWKGKNVPLKQPHKINHSYVRRFPYQDTDQAADWSMTIYPTPAAHNLWHNEPDADHDGIPDIAEDGLDDEGNVTACDLFNGLPLYQYGARAGFTDIFLEVDFKSQGTKKVLSRKTNFFDNIKNTFIQHAPEYKIRVHIDLGEMYDDKMNPQKYNLKNQDLFAAGGQYKRENIDPMAEHEGLRDQDGNYDASYDYSFLNKVHDYMDVRRFYLFRYAGFGFSSSRGSRGASPIPSQTSKVPLAFFIGGMVEGIGSLGSFQHEFGHSMNLEHSGKQGAGLRSYTSVMNYNYLYGVPLQNEADNLIYAMIFCKGNFNPSIQQKLKEKNVLLNYWSTQNPEPKLGLMPVFSKGIRTDINLANINEYHGYGYKEGPKFPVDFNCDGRFSQQVNVGRILEKDFDEYEEIIRFANLKKIHINSSIYKPYINIPLMSQVGEPSQAVMLSTISVDINEPFQCDLHEYLQNKKLRNSEARP